MTPGKLATLAALLLIMAGAMLLRVHADPAGVAGLIDYARTGRLAPLDLVVAAGRARRVVVLGDVHAAAAPKRLAADAIEALARGPGLDVVVLEVDAALQPVIDAYLAGAQEDVTPLLLHPRTLGAGGAPREFLEIYRRVWRLNHGFAPGRRIRILAADLPGWPPERALPPAAAAALFARRDTYMAERIERQVLRGDPGARALVFVGGYHALKMGGAELSVGGGAPRAVTWLGARLRSRHPGEVFSILTDGAGGSAAYTAVAAFRSTRVAELLRRNLPEITAPFALRVDDRFDFLHRPILEVGAPGLGLTLRPDDYRLRDLVDGYIYLGVTGAPTGAE
ncbi:MAG TPA: hypothetical protein VF188_09420 [Longimicrobiales bacterium]